MSPNPSQSRLPNRQPEPIAMLNGMLIDFADASLPIDDLGVMMGAILVERLRTYAGRLVLLEGHLDRLATGCDMLGLNESVSMVTLADQIRTVIQRIQERDSDAIEHGVCVVVTPGSRRSGKSGTVLITADRILESDWKMSYQEGISLQVVTTREVPASSVPKSIKHRSRLHYYLADLEVEKSRSDARALLLNTDGTVAEGTTGTVVAVIEDQWVVPPADQVLASVTLPAIRASIDRVHRPPLIRRSLMPEELSTASEVLWVNATVGILPVTSFNGRAIGSGQPGKHFRKAMRSWSRYVGIELCDLGWQP